MTVLTLHKEHRKRHLNLKSQLSFYTTEVTTTSDTVRVDNNETYIYVVFQPRCRILL